MPLIHARCVLRALPALGARIPDAAQQLKEQHPRWVGDAGDQAQVEQVVAERTAVLALAARAYASRPALTPYGVRPVAATTVNLRLAAAKRYDVNIEETDGRELSKRPTGSPSP